MDTFQMHPKAICAETAFHHPHDMQAFYRMQILRDCLLNHILLGQIELKWVSDCIKWFLSALVDTASKNLDKTSLSQITPAQLMRKAATVRNTEVTLSGKTPMEVAMGRRPRDLMDPSFHESRTADIYTNQTRPPQ